MKRERGFNLLECLLVLVVIAVVSIIGINRYRSYQQHILMANIRSDVKTIQNALDRYYHRQGCYLDGAFSQSLTPNLEALGLNLRGRPPLIPLGNAYQVAIFDTGQLDKKTGEDLHVYGLRVTANFSPTISSSRIEWYQQALGAKYVDGNSLVWETMPSSMATDRGKKLWAMNSQGDQFRHLENEKWKSVTGHIDDHSHNKKYVSPSYCAH